MLLRNPFRAPLPLTQMLCVSASSNPIQNPGPAGSDDIG